MAKIVTKSTTSKAEEPQKVNFASQHILMNSPETTVMNPPNPPKTTVMNPPTPKEEPSKKTKTKKEEYNN